MKKQIVTSPRNIEFQNVPLPEIKDNEILIKIKRIGICGSDIHVYHGLHPNTEYPVTQGHEVSGVIEKVGKKIINFKLEDKVTILPQHVCGKCYSCTHNQYHICDHLQVMGFQAPGTASEYFAVDEKFVLKIPEDFTFEQGAMIEPVAVACGALAKIEKLKGMNVVVLGAGPIGNLTAQVAKALGARSVLITEISNFRREIARKVGIDHIVNPNE
ncbi:MAG TPA: alcohol dehydrogenase catalytic domain-containing protein, partial [Candidatus Bathyarchaeia archaeon]|nr:alcohol dehydrogenase catalytic domain-containing protein [Candidatus Bathyarchaeia archaeon]